MARMHIEPFILDELTIVLADTVRNRIDSAYGMSVPVLVQFDYHPAEDEDDAPTIYHMKVLAQDATLQGERSTLTLWNGCDVTDYLTAAQETAVEQAMLDRMAAQNQAANDTQLEDKAERMRSGE